MAEVYTLTCPSCCALVYNIYMEQHVQWHDLHDGPQR